MNTRSVPLLAIAGLLASAATAADAPQSMCASPIDAQRVRTYYSKFRPGVPLPVPSRFLDVPEVIVASGLTPGQGVGVAGTPQLAKDIWKSIDAWGAKTAVKLVLTSGGKHGFAFPSLVPITQPDDGSGMLDVYADGGKGVHAHIQTARVKAIFATDVPGKEPDKRTRAISYFGEDGELILGVYASIAPETADPQAIAGFERTWALISSMTQLCAAR